MNSSVVHKIHLFIYKLKTPSVCVGVEFWTLPLYKFPPLTTEDTCERFPFRCLLQSPIGPLPGAVGGFFWKPGMGVFSASRVTQREKDQQVFSCHFLRRNQSRWVSNMIYVHPENLGKIPILTRMGLKPPTRKTSVVQGIVPGIGDVLPMCNVQLYEDYI